MSQNTHTTQSLSFKIGGMTCAACSSRVEKGLRGLEGVIDANVNLLAEKATLEIDPEVIQFPEVKAKVEDLGYQVYGGKRAEIGTHAYSSRKATGRARAAEQHSE